MTDTPRKDFAKDAAKTQAKADAKQLKQFIKELSPAQRDLLMRRLSEAVAEVRAQGPELVARNAQVVPLSFAQEREWFRNRMFPGVAHNISGALLLRGRLSMPALSAAFDGILARHQTLRANFADVDGEAVQTIREDASLPIAILDGEDWERPYAEEIAKPFDLSRELLLRASLLRRGENEQLLLVTMHHIAADGWSIGILMRELAELYTAHVEARPPRLPELPIQYGDFAA
ncbi:MAG: condensation domain-containing protein, partial [Thermoanaerobaculia bacterium]